MNNNTSATQQERLVGLHDVEKINPLAEARLSYLEIEPTNPIGDWMLAQQGELKKLLLLNKPILIRGAHIEAHESLAGLIQKVIGKLESEYGDLPPSSDLQSYVFQSTPYPPDKAILFHNEAAHWPYSPQYMAFYCQQPASLGGETPLSSSSELYNQLPAALSEKLSRHGLIYRRNFATGIDIPWQKFFKTADPRVVEELCQESGISVRWLDRSRLQIETKLSCVRTDDNETNYLFHQLFLHHPFCLGKDTQESNKILYSDGEEPRSVRFGNDDPIDDETIQSLLQLTLTNSFCFDWRQGDLLIIDNLKFAHARRPYKGDRLIKVSLSSFSTL